MKYISLFAGIGGFDLALNDLGYECVYVNEWDRYCADIYEKNFGHRPDTRSIKEVRADEIPDHDILVGGFPCQSFSIAGKRGGFNDTRGTLFFDVARIVKEKRPKYLLLENVKGLLSHDKGRTYKIILSTLAELGYNTESLVFNSYFFNSAPRPRVFIYAVYGNNKDDVWKRPKQTLPLYTTFSERIRTSGNSVQKDRGSAERIIRTFARLPSWLDSWDTFYSTEKTDGERSIGQGGS